MTTHFYDTKFYVHLTNFWGPCVWTSKKLSKSQVESVILGYEVDRVTFDDDTWLYRLKAV